jgi:hypothetical protein
MKLWWVIQGLVVRARNLEHLAGVLEGDLKGLEVKELITDGEPGILEQYW